MSDRRRVPAPNLRETADIWWDTGRDPEVAWDRQACCFELVDPGKESNRLLLWRTSEPAADPEAVARALAEGLAACDFPPTGDGASQRNVEKTLRAAGVLDAAR